MRIEHATGRFYLGRDYCEAVEAAGGLPVHIPLIPEREYLTAVVRELDGIVLPGADCDVDPSFFDEDPHPRLGKVIPEKDATDMLVLEVAEEENLPVVAICYGMQVLNVVRGGSLIQDIESQVEKSMKHRQGEPMDRRSHKISIAENNVLSEFAGKSTMVNSHHHQAVGRTGRDLRAIAWANDGIIEGIEDTRRDRFVLGLQWHPELAWRSDVLSQGIFETFVAKCVDRRASRSGSATLLSEGLEVLRG
jgi:putative glutamine amidotransferase